MSLDKAIRYGKEHRKPYRGAKAIDKRCRNHGDCKWCYGNRTYRFRKAALRHCEDEHNLHNLSGNDCVDYDS